MLKKFYDNQSDIPEAYRSLYTERDGKWHFTGVEGMVPSEKVKEFRDTNETLMREKRELEEKLGKFDNIDVERYRELLGKETLLKEGKLYDKNKIDELVAGRTEEMRREHANQLKAVTDAKEAAERRGNELHEGLKRQMIDNKIITVGSRPEFGLEPTGHLDLVNRARSVADLDDKNQLIFKNSDGTKMYGKDGITPMTPDEWVERQATVEAKHLFKPSGGSGTPPGDAGKGGGGGGSRNGSSIEIEGRVYGTGQGQYNPFDKKIKNLTDQGKVMDKDMKLAESMANAAGVKLPLIT